MPAPQTTTTARPDPAELRAAMARVEALDDIAAGPKLAHALAELDLDSVPGLGLTYVMEARNRQANHERGELLVMIGRILRHGLPAAAAAVLREPNEFAADEVRASLRLTRSAATRLCGLAWDLHRRLPAVLAAMCQGRLDQPRAQVFSTFTDGLSREHTNAILVELLPTASELTTPELIEAIARLAIALDPEWIRRRYERALRRRRVVGKRNPDGTATLTGHDLPFDEVAAACARLDALAHAAKAAGHPDRLDHLRVELFLGMLTGRYTHLSDQEILTALHATARTQPDTTDNANTDHGGNSDPDSGDDDGPDDDGPDDDGPDDEGPDDEGPDDEGPDDEGPDDEGPDDEGPDDEGPDDEGPDDGPDDGDDDNPDVHGSGGPDDGDGDEGDPDDGDPDDGCAGDPDANASPDPDQGGDRDPDGIGGGNRRTGHSGPPDDEGADDKNPGDKNPDDEGPDDTTPDDTTPDESTDEGAGDEDGPPGDGPDEDGPPRDGPPGSGLAGGVVVGRRGGLRLWAGLATLMGADQRPAQLLGWGPVHAELACDMARSLRSWWCVLAGADGAPQAIVPIRRRPTGAAASGVRRVGEVWVQIDPDGLRLLVAAARIGLVEPGWAAILAEISSRLEATPAGPANGDPAARLPGAALRRWIHIRDRQCQFPGCRAPAHRVDADHSTEHARGGATTDAGLASACRHDHRLRHEGGWIVLHTAPGQVTWISPLGRRYRPRPLPGLLDLPEPRPGAVDDRDPEPDPEHPLPGWDPISCLQPQPPPPSRPPPAPKPARNLDWIFGRPARPDDEPPPF